MAIEVDSNEKCWLIKSATRILGPYSAEEILAQVKVKHIAIIDEVRRPVGRWMYLREHPYFIDKIKNMVYEVDSGDQTMTESLAHTAITRTDITLTRTDVTPVPNIDEMTPTPIRHSEHTNPGMKDIMPTVERTSSIPSMARSYGAAYDQRVQNRVQKRSHFLLIGITLVALAGGAYTYLKFKPRGDQPVGYEQLVAQALKYKSLGVYGRSLDAYKKAEQIREPTRDIKEMMAPILISEDRQTTEGRRILEASLLGQNRNRSDLVDSYLSIAVSYLLEGNLRSAEDVLRKASGHDPYRPAILMNQAVLEFKRSKYEEAYRGFDTVWQRNREMNLALVGKAMAAVELAKNGRAEYLSTVINEIDLKAARSNYLRAELLLFKAYAESLIGEVNALQKTVSQYLGTMHGQGRNFTQPLDVDWRFIQYESSLISYCRDLAKRVGMGPEIKSLLAICYMESSQDSEASKLLKEASVAAPKNPFVILSQASFNVKIGRFAEAAALLKLPEVQRLPLKNLLLGDLCRFRQDLECARSAYRAVHTAQEADIYANYGLAWVAYSGRNRSSAFDYIRAGLQVEPHFIPLLELRDQMESQ